MCNFLEHGSEKEWFDEILLYRFLFSRINHSRCATIYIILDMIKKISDQNKIEKSISFQKFTKILYNESHSFLTNQITHFLIEMMNRIFEIKNVESCFVKSKTGPNILTNKKFSEPAQNFVHFYQFMNHYSTKYREYLNQKHSSNHLSDNIQNDKNEILRNENNNKEMSQKKFDSIELKDELSIQLRITNSDNNNKSISLVSPIIKKLKTQNVVSFPEEENENSFHEIMAGVNQYEYENKSSDFSIYEEEENHNDCYDKSKETMTIEGLNNNDSISLQNNKDDIIMEDENQPVDISDKMPNLTNSADSGNINSVHLTKSLSNIPLNSENIQTIQLPKRNKKKTRKSSLEILKKEKSKKNRRHIKKIFCSDMSSDTLHINEYDKYTYLNSEKTQLELNDDGNFINNHEPFSYILPSIETGSYQNTSVMNLEDRNIMSTNLESQYIKMNINKQVKCEKEHHNESESVTDLNQYFDPNEKEFFFQQMSDDTSYNQEEKKTNFFQESDLTKNPTKKGKKIVLAKKVMRINKNEIHKYIDQESTENKSPIRCKVSIISKNDYLALKNENELMSDTSSINLMDEDHNISIHKPNKEEQTEKEHIEKEQREKEKIEKKQIEEEQKKKEQKDKEQKEKEQKEKEHIKILSQIDQKKSDLKSKQKNKKAENRIKKKNHKQKKNKNPIIMTSNDSNKIESFNGENNKLLNDNISEISKNTMIHDMAVKTEKEMKKKNSFPKNISTKPPKKDRKHKHSKKHSNRKKQDTDTSSELESLDQGFEIKSFNITYMDLKENETPNEINLHKNTTKDNDDSLKTLVSNLQQSNNDMITSNRSDDNNNKGEKLFQDNIYSKFTKLSIKEKAGIIQFNSFQTNDEQTSSINTSLPANPNHHYYSKPDEQSMTVPSQLPVRRNVRKTNRRFPDAVRH
ncbi:hypothetical protein TRFO_38863 [Tritrichomonas foetus]|uniref:Uncharacterized protein n=1 Tax=Tritrichomonas foetus TaxID=1144522 RepID=A0A1J4J8D5_9EUKA|nr:hypothetical protein TRFO_38863 [Tritrichomonas foetus]|eukprot:OHS94953.1 hypothetical protein TRFO_38863 [Tritrichomonas foetus]